MKHTRGRVVEVETLAELDRRLAAGVRSMRGWRLRRLDLTGHGAALRGRHLEGATFLGCTFAGGDVERVEADGGLVLPDLSEAPVDVYRSRLYTPEELYDDRDYRRTLDARAYAWSQRQPTSEDALAEALHDHAIDTALTDWTRSRHLVGVMGGHAAERGQTTYADAARLGRALGRDAVVATGGGPGAMEAANLGAALAAHSTDDLGVALELLATVPSFRPSVTAWVRCARAVLERFPPAADSLGIPTWHYGHEPPNVFATAIAKYFGNPTREAILLEVCDRGIVFLPGAGGTVQEIFQDACENYYADETAVAPMVLVGRQYWTETLPAWPLLHGLAKGRAMEGHVHLVDTVDEAVSVVDLVSRPGGPS